jgi:hypothetical protein
VSDHLSDQGNTFDLVKINDPIDPKVFDLTIPAGMPVHDARKGTVYTMGPDGKPIGKVQPAPVPPPPLPGTEAGTSGKGSWTTSAWVAGLAASVVLGLLSTVYLSRMRNRSQ